MRLIFDTSTLVGAALQIGSIPHRALATALATGQLCASAQTLTELQEVLRRPKFDRYLPIGMRKEFFDIVATAAVVYEVSAGDEAEIAPRCCDPKDDMFLVLALVCQADIIVSSDSDLLALDPWNETRILKPAAYLERHA